MDSNTKSKSKNNFDDYKDDQEELTSLFDNEEDDLNNISSEENDTEIVDPDAGYNIEYVNEVVTEKLQSVMDIMKILAPKEITQMSNVLGGTNKSSITESLFANFVVGKILNKKDWQKQFNELSERRSVLYKKKTYNEEGLELPLLADPNVFEEPNAIPSHSINKTNKVVDSEKENATNNDNITGNDPIDRHAVSSEKSLDNNLLLILQNLGLDQLNLDENMADILGVTLIRLLKTIAPEYANKIKEKIKESKKISSSEMLNDEINNGPLLLNPKKTKKQNEKQEEKTLPTQSNQNNGFPQPTITKDSRDHRKDKDHNHDKGLEDRPSRDQGDEEEGKGKCKDRDGDGDGDGDGERPESATVFYLQEKDKVKKTEEMITRTKYISSYKEQSQINTKKQNANKKKDGDNNEDIDAEEKNKGILFHKRQH